MTQHELDRQIQTLHDLGYPALAGMSRDELEALLAPVRDRFPADAADAAGTDP